MIGECGLVFLEKGGCPVYALGLIFVLWEMSIIFLVPRILMCYLAAVFKDKESVFLQERFSQDLSVY